MEVVESNAGYIAKYVGKWSGMPHDLKALCGENRIRLVWRSPGLREQKDGAGWTYHRGRRENAENWLAMMKTGKAN